MTAGKMQNNVEEKKKKKIEKWENQDRPQQIFSIILFPLWDGTWVGPVRTFKYLS